MADVFSPTKRSAVMAAIRGKGNYNTELRLIALLRAHRITGWRRGVRLLGNPDFVFRTKKIAVFVDGCFWHGCPKHGRIPGSRQAYWLPKLTRNAERDRQVSRELRRRGWKVVRIWECALTQKLSKKTVARLCRSLAATRDSPLVERVSACDLQGGRQKQVKLAKTGD
jgi:DNA mismatch endonuclease, patch repair protein